MNHKLTRNENNKSNRNRSLVVLLVLCAMFASAVAGCNKPVAENPAPELPEPVENVSWEDMAAAISEGVNEV